MVYEQFLQLLEGYDRIPSTAVGSVIGTLGGNVAGVYLGNKAARKNLHSNKYGKRKDKDVQDEMEETVDKYANAGKIGGALAGGLLGYQSNKRKVQHGIFAGGGALAGAGTGFLTGKYIANKRYKKDIENGKDEDEALKNYDKTIKHATITGTLAGGALGLGGSILR